MAQGVEIVTITAETSARVSPRFKHGSFLDIAHCNLNLGEGRNHAQAGPGPTLLFLRLVFVDSKTPAAAPCFAVFKAWAPEAMNSWVFLARCSPC